jgi:hypothetical protein
MNESHHNIEKRLHFGGDLLQKDRLHLFYESVFDRETDRELVQIEHTMASVHLKSVFQIDDVPEYLNTTLRRDLADLRIKEVNTYEGSLINLTKFKNLEDYMNNVLSSQRRATLRRCEKRLQLCIRPVYKMYFGGIDKPEYDKIFKACHQMLLRRHQQKNTYWEELEFWQQRYDSLYRSILQKKASIFTIYHNERPIAIYVNSTHGHILDIDVIAYDIDYSKFKLGFIALTSVIQWAFENNFRLVDMSKGDFYYKERFRTGNYIFKKQLIYDAADIRSAIRANLTLWKLSLTYKLLPILKMLKINKLYRSFVRNKKKSLFKNVQVHSPKFRIEKSDKVPSVESLIKINIDDGKYSFLREKFFDFLFLNFEFDKDVSVYHSRKNSADYYFMGKETAQKLTIITS